MSRWQIFLKHLCQNFRIKVAPWYKIDIPAVILLHVWVNDLNDSSSFPLKYFLNGFLLHRYTTQLTVLSGLAISCFWNLLIESLYSVFVASQ